MEVSMTIQNRREVWNKGQKVEGFLPNSVKLD